MLVLCPIQYWPFIDNADNSWYFAVNYAAAHHLITGVDIVGESGPLGYLGFPQDIGNNLAKALTFQIVLWAVVLFIVWRIFWRSSAGLRRIAFFTVFLGLSAKLFQYPDPLGVADLLLAAAMILIVQFQVQGGISRYIAALFMLGLAPLIKFVSLFVVAGLSLGIVLDRLLHRQGKWVRELLFAVLVPLSVIGTGYWLSMGSLSVIYRYLRSSMELSSGYSRSMSLAGPPIQFVEAFVLLLLLAITLRVMARSQRRLAVFLVLLLGLPLALNLKHSFVRQDSAHTMHLFCFFTLVLALVALAADLSQRQMTKILGGALIVSIAFWPNMVARGELRSAVGAVTGMRTPYMIWPLFPFSGGLRQTLQARSDARFPAEKRVEAEIRSIIGDEPVASLSEAYSDLLMDGLHPVFYPVVLRHTAYTPYLDRLNADWVREHGPRFLVFNAESIDGRHPWTDTPAMWIEVYRWYRLRFPGHRNVLLERRLDARFSQFELLSRNQVHWGEELQPPAVASASTFSGAIFWRMECAPTLAGSLRQLFFRIPEVTMNVQNQDGQAKAFRFLPAVAVAPSIGNYLPVTVAEFAAVFDDNRTPDFFVKALSFDGPGATAYPESCDFQWLRLK